MRHLMPFLDALFADQREHEPPAAAQWGRFVGVALLLMVIIAVRRSEVVTNPQFFAEDGWVFFPQNAALGFARALGRFYQGFPYLTHRLVAWLGGLGPVTAAPRIYATSAVVIDALSVATFVLPGFRHLVRSDALRILLAIAVVTLPSPGDDAMLGTAVFVGWYIAVWLTLVSLVRLPRTAWGAAGLTLAAVGAVFSTPLAIINLPLWGLRLLSGFRRGDRIAQVFAGALILSAATVVLLTPRLGVMTVPDARILLLALTRKASGEIPFSVATVTPYLAQVAALRVAGLFLPSNLLTPLQNAPGTLALVAAGWLIGLLLVSRFLPRCNRAAVVVALSLAFLSLVVALMGRPLLMVINPWPLRYALYPDTMLCLATIIVLDAVPGGSWRGLATGVVALLFAWPRTATFFIAPLPDLRWSTEGPRLERMLRTKCPLQIGVPLNPRVMPFKVEWGSVYPAMKAPPSEVVGTLAATDSVTSIFTAQCGDLSMVELNLAPLGAGDGTLELELFGADDNRLVASARIDRSAIRDRWATFCLPPQTGSKGTRYAAVLRAPSADAASPLQILGSRGDPFGAEQTRFGDRLAPRPANLRHGCVDRDEPTLPYYDQVQSRFAGGASAVPERH